MAHSYPKSLELLIDGNWHPIENRRSCEVVNPATEEVLGHLPMATLDDLNLALESAKRGFGVWSSYSAWKRSEILLKAAEIIKDRRTYIAHILTLENGKPLADSLGELDRSIETFVWCAEEGKRTYGRVMPVRTVGTTEMSVKRPVGPVAAFAPWNFPVVLVVRKIAAALAAGCSVVVKPAEETPAACIEIARACVDAGVPAGAINMVFGDPAMVSEHLIASPIIQKVSFTGSIPVGKLLSQQAAALLKPVTMELGGHSPVVVFDDINIQAVVKMCVNFKFRNAGQVCLSPNRFYVHERVYDKFIEQFIAATRSINVGNGLSPNVQMGPLNNPRRLSAAEKFVEDAVSKQAKVGTGGKRLGSAGYFFEPTVLTGLSPDALILAEEPFCPVVPIMPFASFDEVVDKANHVQFGLAAYAFTDSLTTSEKISEAFEAGWIGINSFTPSLADVAIGGMKQSGIGYEGGPEGLDAYLHSKFISKAISL